MYNDVRAGAMAICQSDEVLISWVGERRKHET